MKGNRAKGLRAGKRGSLKKNKKKNRLTIGSKMGE